MKKGIGILLLCLSGLGFGVFFAPLVIYGIFNVGNIFGMLLTGGLFFCVLFWPRVKRIAGRVWHKKAGKALAIVLAAMVLCAGVFGTAIGVKIARAATQTPPEGETLTVVVLGCRVYNSGPSRMLVSRVGAAYEYLVSHPDAVCVLSGGQGDDEPMTEAQAMSDMLTARGVSPERLILEDESRSTKENLRFSMEKIKALGLSESIALVTSEYHLYRASLYAKDAGFAVCYGIPAPSQRILLPTYFIREIFGVAYASLSR